MTEMSSFEKCYNFTIILYFHVQIEICCYEIDSGNIIHVYIQAKTDKAVN